MGIESQFVVVKSPLAPSVIDLINLLSSFTYNSKKLAGG